MQTYKLTLEVAGETITAIVKARNKFDAVRLYMTYFESAEFCETVVNVEEAK